MSAAPTIVHAKAWVLGSRLDLRRLSNDNLVATGPNTYALGEGRFLAVFRYGAVVIFGLNEEEQAARTARLLSFVTDPFDVPQEEALEIRIDRSALEGLEADGNLVLNKLEIGEVQVVSHVLAKSAVLAHYEERVTEAFSRVEQRARAPVRSMGRRRVRELVEEMRTALEIQVQTVGRVEMTEKPELIWEDTHLDRLYEQLAAEFELRERDTALTRKLGLISDSAATSLELIHTRQSLRVEWYIVILIVVEIALVVYELIVD